jgi:DNA-binding protein HU-beta
MTLPELIRAVAACARVKPKVAERVVREFAHVVVDAVADGERVAIPGLGVFRARHQPARETNGATHHHIEARSILTFRAFTAVRILNKGAHQP